MRVDVVRGIKGTGGSWFFPCTVHRNHCSVFKKVIVMIVITAQY